MRLLSVSLLLAAGLAAEGGASKVVKKQGIDPVFQKHGIKVQPAEGDRRMQPFLGVVNPGMNPYTFIVENGSSAAIVEIQTILYRYPSMVERGIPGILTVNLGPAEAVQPGDWFIASEARLSEAMMAHAKKRQTAASRTGGSTG